MKNKYKKAELKFIKNMSKQLRKLDWDTKNIRKCYKYFKLFTNSQNIEELSLLRYGENFVKQEISNFEELKPQDTRKLIIQLCNTSELEIPVTIASIGFILKVTLANETGAIDYSELKEVR